MRLRTLRLHNYRRYRDQAIEFPDGVVAIVGRNGSGKSTLLEALGFALFGADAMRTPKELLRNDQAGPGDPVRVELEADVGGQRLRIVRELKGKALTPTCTLEVDGQLLVPGGGGSNAAATQEVERRLGVDWEGFCSTVVARQGELARLAAKKPAERKQLLLRMLGVDQVQEAIARAREARGKAEARLQALRAAALDPQQLDREAEAAAAAARQAEAAAAQAQAALAHAQAQRAAAEAMQQAALDLHRARSHLALHQRAAEQAAAALADAAAAAGEAPRWAALAAALPACEAALQAALAHEAARRSRAQQASLVERQARIVAKAERELAGWTAPELPAKPPEGAAEEAARREAEARQAASLLGYRLAEARRRLAHIAHLGSDAPCPTCERPLEGTVDALRARLEAEAAQAAEGALRKEADAAAAAAERQALARLQSAWDAAQRAQEAAAARRAALEEAVARERANLIHLQASLGPDLPPTDLAPLQAAQAEARAAHTAFTLAEASAARVPALRLQAQEAQAARAAAEAQVRDLAARIPAEAHAGGADRLLAAARAAERQAQDAAAGAAARHTQAVAAVAVSQARLAEAERLRAQAREAESDLRIWTALADGRQGGLLERFRDHLVARVGPAVSREASRLMATFTAGRYSEVLLDGAFEVYLADGGTHYTLDRFSGGEADLVHLALRLAVSRLLAERSGGAELRMLALDEVFGSLDRERRDLVVQALQQLGGLYAQVLVISHLEGLEEMLDAALVVEEAAGAARLMHNA